MPINNFSHVYFETRPFYFEVIFPNTTILYEYFFKKNMHNFLNYKNN